MELKDKEMASIEDRLQKLSALCHGDLRAQNHIRIVKLIINKAKRRNGKL